MKLSLKILSLALSASILTGCATSALWDKADDFYSMPVALLLSDDLVALGKPKTPLSQYPHALAMVGTKHDYLVVSGEKDPAILQKIFGELEGKSLHLLGSAEGRYTLRPDTIYQEFFTGKTQVDFYVSPDIKRTSKAKQSLQESGVTTDVMVTFFKPAKQVTASEKATLAKLGFECTSDRLKQQGRYGASDSHTDDPTVYTLCHRNTHVKLTVIQKTTDNANLPHKFKRPLTININHHKNNTLKDGAVTAGTALLTPVAVAIDVVTFPVQLVVCSVAWCFP